MPSVCFGVPVNKQRHSKSYLLITTATLLTFGYSILASTSALAQGAPAASAENAQAASQPATGGLDDIVVTARKRAENLQDTPIAITAFSGEALEERQINNVGDVGRFAPNVSLDPVASLSGSSASITTFIRGVGQTDFNITIDPGVGLYVDGVYVARSVGALLDLGDVSSVQILRGPQGTLFGKNTIGGAIIINSNQPTDDFELAADVTTGSYNRLDGRLVVNVPVSDRFSLRAVGAVQTRDGYVKRLIDGGRQGNKNSIGGRLIAKLDVTDDFTATFSIDGNRRREESAAQTLLSISEGILPGVGGFQSFFYNKVLAAPNCGVPGQPSPLGNPACFNSQWLTDDIDETYATANNQSDFDLWGTNLTLDWDLGPVAIKSITAYRHMKSKFTFDFDGSPLRLNASSNNIVQKQYSQELQFAGSLLNDRLKWTTGLFYLKEKAQDDNFLTFGFVDFLSRNRVDNDSYAAYAQFTFQVTDRFSITPGLRYTDEKKRFDPTGNSISDDRTGGELLMLSRCFVSRTPTFPPNPTCIADPVYNPTGTQILPAIEVSTRAKELTPAVTLDYKFTDRMLGYASYSKGFKSGGFTQRIFPPEPAATAFAPEFVETYELGLKTELFDRRLRLNGAVFQSDYTDIQIVVNEGLAPKVRNAGTARIKGFELEGDAALTDWLRLSGGVGYLDAYYRSVSPTATPVTVDSRFPNVPKWTASAAVNAVVWEADERKFTVRGDWTYRSSHYKDAVNSIDLLQSGYSVFGASATLDYRQFELTVGVTNLGDKRYLLGGYVDLIQASTATGMYSRPREWFLKLGYRY